ncbi:MAG: hypothetical protein SNG10_06380 [Rikenellaceae bacterium]
MKARKFLLGLVASVMSLSVAPVMAAELEASAGVDVVSSYVWRGMYQGAGAAIQPGMGVSLGNFTLDAWGSTSFSSITEIAYPSAHKELDFTLGYSVGGFSIALTDYWWSGEGASYFASDAHMLEVALGYTFGDSFPLSIGVSTMICGADKASFYKEDGSANDQAYSTYITLDYPFAIGDVDVNANIGLTPAAGMYSGYDEAGVCSVGLTFSYDLVKSDKFSLPVFVDTSFSPIQDNAYIVAGFSFSL